MTVAHLYADNPVKSLLETYGEALLDFDQLQNVPDPTWMVDSVLPNDSIAVLWGESGAGKSFVAVDLALSVATGTPWMGHPVKQGNVFYITGEGVKGFKKRVNAWAEDRDERPYDDEFLCLTKAVNFLDPDRVAAVTQLIREQGASLIVIDTLARAMVGHSENDSTEMGRFVDVAEGLREELKATLLFIHHATVSAGMRKMRGSTALKGAVDTEIELEAFEGEPARSMYCRKQKDAAPFPPKSLFLRSVGTSLVTSKCQFVTNGGPAL